MQIKPTGFYTDSIPKAERANCIKRKILDKYVLIKCLAIYAFRINVYIRDINSVSSHFELTAS